MLGSRKLSNDGGVASRVESRCVSIGDCESAPDDSVGARYEPRRK